MKKYIMIIMTVGCMFLSGLVPAAGEQRGQEQVQEQEVFAQAGISEESLVDVAAVATTASQAVDETPGVQAFGQEAGEGLVLAEEETKRVGDEVPEAPLKEEAERVVTEKVKQERAEREEQRRAQREAERKEYEEEEVKEEARGEVVDSNTRTLLTFLDEAEIIMPSTIGGALTQSAVAALYQEAAPILISGALLAHIFNIDGNHDQSIKDILHDFYEKFDATRWNIYRLDRFFLLIPKRDLETNAVSMRDFTIAEPQKVQVVADRKDFLITYFNDNNKQEYYGFRRGVLIHIVGEYVFNSKVVGAHLLTLVSTLLNKENEMGVINWVFYLYGHGRYGNTIAGISIKEYTARLQQVHGALTRRPVKGGKSQFQQLLDFLDKKIKTKLFVYSSCYAAGFNAKKVYGELTEQSGGSIYSFAIVTGATADAPTYVGKVWDDRFGLMMSEIKFDEFVKEVKKEPGAVNYIVALGYLFPLIKRDVRFSEEVGGIPQIRPPHVPAWFPIVDANKAVIRIGTVMAAARKETKEPLMIKPYRDKNGHRQDPKAVLLATEKVDFPIIFSGLRTTVPFVSLLPGAVTHTLTSVIYDGSPFDVKEMVGNVAYGDMKKIVISKLTEALGYREKRVFTNVTIEIVGKINLLERKLETVIKAFWIDKEGNKHILKGSSDWDKFFRGVYRGDEKLVARVLRIGMDVNAREDSFPKQTALHIACSRGRENIVSLLLKNGADVSIKDGYGDTPLLAAAKGGKIDIVVLLFRHGEADKVVNTPDLQGITPLLTTCLQVYSPAAREKMVKLLLRHGADPDVKDRQERSARSVMPGLIRSLEQDVAREKEAYERSWRGRVSALGSKVRSAIQSVAEPVSGGVLAGAREQE